MRFRLLVVLCSFLLSFSNHTYAGFVVKKSLTAADSSSTIAPISDRAASRAENKQILQTVKALAFNQKDDQGTGRPRGGDTSGWEGIVALCCGILGFATGWLAIPAIIFGALGMRRGKNHRGLAIAGFVMGVVVLAILILILVLALAIFGWWI